MPATKEIKNHIRSIRDIQKITNAMYLIASKKLQKVKAELDATRPFFEAVRTEIKRVFRHDHGVESRYFYPVDPHSELSGPTAFLVITADKGLAGAYNMNVIREAQKQIRIHGGEHYRLYVVGEYGRQYFLSRGIPVEKSFLYTAQNPNLDRAREITQVLLDIYDRGEAVKLYIVYTDMENAAREEAVFARLLPFHRADFRSEGTEDDGAEFEFFPDLGQVLDAIVPSFMTGYIYSALVDSFCSEQDARMTAMDAASTSAGDLICELSKQYNHVRQGVITQEISELSGSAAAMRRMRGDRS